MLDLVRPASRRSSSFLRRSPSRTFYSPLVHPNIPSAPYRREFWNVLYPEEPTDLFMINQVILSNILNRKSSANEWTSTNILPTWCGSRKNKKKEDEEIYPMDESNYAVAMDRTTYIWNVFTRDTANKSSENFIPPPLSQKLVDWGGQYIITASGDRC